MNEGNIVGIVKISKLQNKEEIKNCLENILNTLKEKNKVNIPINSNVMIKPNICLVKGYETGATVDPYIVKCLVDWILKNYKVKSIIIGEADATQLNIDLAFKVLGWEETFAGYQNVKLLNLSKDDLIDLNLNGLYFKNIKMSRTYMESDYLISVAKLKTHTMTGITCNLKNIYGANPIKYKAQYHKNLDSVIYDLNKVKYPNLCLVDGIIAMEGPGPVNGIPKPTGLLIAGNDVVATDYECARIMGFNPKKISHIQMANKQKLGSSQYNAFGDSIDIKEYNFAFYPFWQKIIVNIYNNKFLFSIPYMKKIIIKICGVSNG